MDISPEELLTDIFQAYFDARKHKRNTQSQLAFEMKLEHNLVTLYEQIINRTYRPSPCCCFITEYPVKREIFASSFRDRVIHHLLFNYIAPLFERRMIFDSYSCRVGKGTMLGIKRFEHHIRSCTDNYTRDAYILKLDLKGYFMSIDKARLYEIIQRTLNRCAAHPSGDGRTWDQRIDFGLVDFLLQAIMFRNPIKGCHVMGSKSDWDGLPPSKSLLFSQSGIGLPIGDLTSQLFSNIYLDVLDEYVKRKLGCRHYGRYVDDFYIVDPHRSYLKELIPHLRDFLAAELRLTLHPDKIVLMHYAKGASFLGAVVRPYRRYPVKRTTGMFRMTIRALERECLGGELTGERLTEMLSVINSYCGHLKCFKAYKILSGQFEKSPLKRYFYFSPNYHKAKIKYKYKSKTIVNGER